MKVIALFPVDRPIEGDKFAKMLNSQPIDAAPLIENGLSTTMNGHSTKRPISSTM
jgi:hypothetical protein